MTLTLAGLMGSSTIGHATEVERTVAPSTLQIPTADPAAPTLPQPAADALSSDALATVTATPKTRYSSLAHAVAAQSAGGEDEDLRCLAGAIYFESKGEPLVGQLGVAKVILNRTKSGRYPGDVCAVIKQRGQFGFVRGGQIPAINSGSLAYRTAVAVAKVALTGSWDDPVSGALYFNGVRAPRPGGKRVATIGGHAFYR